MSENGGTWSPERVEWLREAWSDRGLSATEIGKQLGISRNAALGKLNRLGLLGNRQQITVRTPRVTAPKPPAPKPPSQKVAIIVEPEPDPATLVTVADVRDSQCRWPVGDPSSEGFRYCGKECHRGHPYCDDHEEYLRGSRRARVPRKEPIKPGKLTWNPR